MTNNMPSGAAKKHHESIEQESRQTAKMFFFLLLLLLLTEQCTSPSLSSMFEVTRGDSNCSLKNYGFLYDAIFSSHVRMRTNHLAIITQDFVVHTS